MDIQAYATEGRRRYAELAETVASILRAAIERAGQLRLQDIQRRAKDVESLRKKLAKLTNPALDVELAVKDLGGCRVVFYTNSDVTRLLNAGVIQDNFEVDWARTKIHHPTKDEPGSDELFHSHNFVVRLKEPRVDLPEHAHIAGLWCEVQVQTTLNHAWSEMAHDTIYKKPDLDGFGASLLKSIDDRMANIMRDYLLPAGYEFQKVVTDFERLSAGKELFDSKPLDALKKSTDNNERYDILSRFLDTVLPQYDDIDGVQEGIRNAMMSVVHASRETAPKAVETPFETLGGRTSEDVSKQALEVLDRLRYLGEDAARLTWRALVDLYPDATSHAERKRILESVHNLARNDLGVWEVAGPVVQRILTEELTSLPAERVFALRPLVLKAIDAMQNLEAETTSFKADTFTLSRGIVPYSPELAEIRGRCFAILRELLESSASDRERKDVIACLRQAMHLGHNNAPAETLAMVVRDVATITELFTEFAPRWSFELRQELEHDALWDYRRHVATDPGTPSLVDENARAALAQALLQLREVLNSDEEFQIFKVLVGYNSIFEPSWENPEFEVEGIDEYRKERRSEIIAAIDDADEAKWRERLLRCAGTDSTDAATLPPFLDFLQELGAAKPAMVLVFIRDGEALWERFLPEMLKGVEAGGLAAELDGLVDGWIESGKHLASAVRYLESAERFSAERLVRATRKAISLEDDRAGVLFAVSAISTRHRSTPGGLWPIFLEAVRHLNAHDDARWIRFVWAKSKKESIFSGLSAADAAVALELFRLMPTIDYPAESVLAAIAADWPRLVIDFFADRVRHSRSVSFQSFDAIPRGFHLLQKILPNEQGYLLAVARKLLDEDPGTFRFRGVLLLNNVFPKYSEQLNAGLLEVVQSASEADLGFVARVLEKYKSDPTTYGLCREIAARTVSEDVLVELRIAMTYFGVVSGEYGMADAHQRVKDAIASWAGDARDSVRAFAKAFSHQLEQTIASERRSALLRQRHYLGE